MINKAINACYVITIPYRKKGRVYEQKFLSQHQMTTKRFKKFRDNYFTNVLKLNVGRIGADGTLGSQITVSKADWSDVKEWVLEGITELEKCY